MSVENSGPAVLIVPDTVEELVTDVGWQAACDQVCTARTTRSPGRSGCDPTAAGPTGPTPPEATS